MRKIFIMLLIALTAVTTVSAQRKQQVSTPTNVIKTFEFICDLYGQKNNQVYSVNKNPNTGIIESKEVITPFVCKKNSAHIKMIADNFRKDEPVSYQLMHVANGTLDNFLRISVATGNTIKYVNLRTRTNQEMWYMAVKNPENPQLRDVYAIVWENKDAENVQGNIYMITSLRPDIYEKDMEKDPSKTFKIEGRVDANIKDSLYNVYIADSYADLSKLGDDDYIACVPVINKRFEYSVQLDKPKAGRIRCIFPDGSLCSAWIDLDMVPGETYHITVHNGYFDADHDYERRVGRYSGKSLVAGHEYDDVVADTVAVWDDDNETEWHQAEAAGNPLDKLTPAQKANFERMAGIAQNTEEKIKGLLEGIENRISYIQQQPSNLTQRNAMESLDSFFEELIKLDTQFDKQAIDLLTAISYGYPQRLQAEAYKELLNELSKQNKMFNELYKHFGGLSKKATKCQKHINKLMEKYMNEIIKLQKDAQ